MLVNSTYIPVVKTTVEFVGTNITVVTLELMSLNQRYIFFIQFDISKYGTLQKHIVDSTTKS